MTSKVQTIKDEESDFYSDDDLFKISSWGADLGSVALTVSELLKIQLHPFSKYNR